MRRTRSRPPVEPLAPAAETALAPIYRFAIPRPPPRPERHEDPLLTLLAAFCALCCRGVGPHA